MKKSFMPLVLTCFAAFFSFTLPSDALLEGLLKAPVFSPQEEPVVEEERAVPPQFPNPGEEAPLEELHRFWGQALANGQYYDVNLPRYRGPQPSSTIRHRLFDSCGDNLAQIIPLLPLFEGDPDISTKIYRLYRDEIKSPKRTLDQQKKIHHWLMCTSDYFRDELIIASKQITFKGSMEGEEYLTCLARLDWPAAEPILKKFLGGKDQRRKALAACIAYQHAQTEGKADEVASLRRILIQLVESRQAPGYARDRAFEALWDPAWPGRDDWYLSLFADESLLLLGDGNYGYTILRNPVGKFPDDWIPRIVPLVGSANRAIHDNAVNCLIQFHLNDTREDALRPLVPWISQPSWSSAQDRLRLIQSMDRVNIPEALPGLLWVLANETNSFMIRGAAEALARWGGPDAVAPLKETLHRVREMEAKAALIKAIMALDGFSDEEIENHLLQFAREKGQEGWNEEEFLMKLYTGFLSQEQEPSPAADAYLVIIRLQPGPDLVERLINRCRKLAQEDPRTAVELWHLLLRWPSKPLFDEWVARLESDSLDLPALLAGLQYRQEIYAIRRAEIQVNAAKGGLAAALDALMSGDDSKIRGILQGSDIRAAAYLLACARYVRLKLPLEEVAKALGHDQADVRQAGIEYLKADDRAAAFKVLQDHPGSGYSLAGRRMEWDPGHDTYPQFDKWSEELIAEFSSDHPPVEIYALLSAGYWGHREAIVVRRYPDHSTLTLYEGPEYFRRREFDSGELQQLSDWANAQAVDSLPPLETMTCDGIQYEYLHLLPRSGRRVFMNNPDLEAEKSSTYARMVAFFYRFSERGEFEFHKPEDALPRDVKILHQDERWPARVLYHDGRRLLVLVGGGSYSIPEWRVVGKDGVDSRPVEESKEYPCLKWCDDIPEEDRHDEHLNVYPWQARAGASIIRALYREGKSGLWKCKAGKVPRLLADVGQCAFPLTSPDGQWVLAARTRTTWADPNDMIRIHIQDGRIFLLDLPPADALEPVCYIPAWGCFLVRRTDDKQDVGAGSEMKYYLVEPSTGVLRQVEGEFEPLMELRESFRPMQSTGNPDEHWAVLKCVDKGGRKTTVGTYNSRVFRFKPVLEMPGVYASVSQIWVESETGDLYFVSNQVLYRWPGALSSDHDSN